MERNARLAWWYQIENLGENVFWRLKILREKGPKEGHLWQWPWQILIGDIWYMFKKMIHVAKKRRIKLCLLKKVFSSLHFCFNLVVMMITRMDNDGNQSKVEMEGKGPIGLKLKANEWMQWTHFLLMQFTYSSSLSYHYYVFIILLSSSIISWKSTLFAFQWLMFLKKRGFWLPYIAFQLRHTHRSWP